MHNNTTESGGGDPSAFFGIYRTMKNINILLAGIPLTIRLRHPDFLSLLEPYRTNLPPVTEVQVPMEHIDRVRRLYTPETAEAYIEATESASFASAALLPYNRAVFHAVAFTWENRGYLVTAPSGTGKSTQYALWKKLCSDSVQIINGDKPLLSFDSSAIVIHPTPWAGKENMAQIRTAPLAGIIIVEQADEDSMKRLSSSEAAVKIFCQFLIPATEKKEAMIVAAMTDRMLRETPIWLFRNRGLLEGTKICRDTLAQYEKERAK